MMTKDKTIDLSTPYLDMYRDTKYSPIDLICMNHKVDSDLIKWLIDEHNANFNTFDSYCVPGIMHLCENPNFTVECFAYLISKGVQYDYTDPYCQNCVGIAVQNKRLDILKFINDNSLHITPPPGWTDQNMKEFIREQLIALG